MTGARTVAVICDPEASPAFVIGALGTGFETEQDVRELAYSEREAERNKQPSRP